MPEKCLGCGTEVGGDVDICPKCRRNVMADKLRREISVLSSALEGWKLAEEKARSALSEIASAWKEEEEKFRSSMERAIAITRKRVATPAMVGSLMDETRRQITAAEREVSKFAEKIRALSDPNRTCEKSLRELFVKYVRHVGDCDGCELIGGIYSQFFTDEENALLEKIRDETEAPTRRG